MNALTRTLTLALALTTTAPAALAALKEGDTAPLFAARAALDGQAFDFTLRAALRSGPVVVYFYPAAFTNGCSLQAKAFAQRHEQFLAAGATVLGVSLDPIARLQAFSADADTCAGKVAVASDADGRIARAFDIRLSAPEAGRKNRRGEDIAHARAERSTFVIGRDGRIAATVGGVAPLTNVEQALAAVQRLAAAPGR